VVIVGGHIFLIFKYLRMSGNDVTASSPSAAVAAVMVTAVMYPSDRIVRLLFLQLIGVSGPAPESPGRRGHASVRARAGGRLGL
jgi:hypothetical protein